MNDQPTLVGVEIGRALVRLAVLDADGNIADAVEQAIAKAGGPRDPIQEEFATRSAVESGLERLRLSNAENLLLGTTIGFPNCGVGSGPALRDWLETLSDEIGEPIVMTGDEGVSYAPAACVDFARQVFEPTGLRLEWVNLAPVAAVKAMGSLQAGAVTLGSGVVWAARMLNGQVLEAFEAVDGSLDEVLHIVADGVARPIDHLGPIGYDEAHLRHRGVRPVALAPAVGAALALLEFESSNLLDAKRVPAIEPEVPVRQTVAAMGHATHDTAPRPTARADATPERVNPSLDPQFDDFRQRYGDFDPDAVNVNDTYRLAKLNRKIERSRELTGPPKARARRAEYSPPQRTFESIEDFAHPEKETHTGFRFADFMLGALGMLVIVLVVALVIL